MSSPYLDLTSSSNSEEAWFATVKKQLRNPPIDTPLWPFGILIVILMFYIPTAFLIKDSFTHYWPEWHTSLIISVGALNLPLMAFWSMTIFVTWLYDTIKHQPTITSKNPTIIARITSSNMLLSVFLLLRCPVQHYWLYFVGGIKACSLFWLPSS